MSVSTIVVAANAMTLRRLDLRPVSTMAGSPARPRPDKVTPHGAH